MSCPIDHKKEGDGAGKCPVGGASSLNPFNMMPAADQSTAPGQKVNLSKRRERSSIPMADYRPAHQPDGTETWTYPSEQQYYNAMQRKGWNPQEKDMSSIVAIHNIVNERGWSQVIHWEKTLHKYDLTFTCMHLFTLVLFLCYSCPSPKLVRFIGRPKDVTPKAYLMSWLGYVALIP
jgi:cytochrome c heme-lyase